MVINEPEIAASAINIVRKTWGVEYWIVNCNLYAMKYLKIIPGYQCSIHSHKKKDETFVGLSGDLQLNLYSSLANQDHSVVHIGPGDFYRVYPKQFHSFQAHNVTWVMEVSTHHDDADVIRLQESRKLEP